MNTLNLTLAQIQNTMTRLLSNAELADYMDSDKVTTTERQVLDLVPRDRMILYADGTFSKRMLFSRSTFAATSKAFGLRKWADLVGGYWKTQNGNLADPVFALANFPQYLHTTFANNEEMSPWIDLADFELTVALVTNSTDQINTNKRALPGNMSSRRLAPIINHTVQVKCYHHQVATIAKQMMQRRKPATQRLRSPMHVVIYQDPVTRYTRIQQIGKVAANLISRALDKPTSFADLYESVPEQLPNQPQQNLDVSLKELLERLRTAGIITAVCPLTPLTKETN